MAISALIGTTLLWSVGQRGAPCAAKRGLTDCDVCVCGAGGEEKGDEDMAKTPTLR